jgi:hypothetical protein
VSVSNLTRGERVLEPCRPLGEGYYAIVAHEKHEHTHLVYVLELPKEIGTVQKAFNIREEGIILIHDMIFENVSEYARNCQESKCGGQRRKHFDGFAFS